MPIKPGTKRPGVTRGLDDWSTVTGDYLLSEGRHQFTAWCRSPAGVGVLCGAVSGNVVAIDLDVDDPKAVALVMALPGLDVTKKGSKGVTRFFRFDPADPVQSKKLAGVLDVLSDGRQTVLPPTQHPDTGREYCWLSDTHLDEVEPADLPLISTAEIEALRLALRALGYVEPADGEKPGGDLASSGYGGSGLWGAVNRHALANLDGWVPELGLEKCRRKRNGAYEAVAHWRPSSSGRPLRERNPNLGIHPEGIRDHASQAAYTPIDLVAAALGVTADEAREWLHQRVGPDLPPFTEPPGNKRRRQEREAREAAESAHAAADLLPPLDVDVAAAMEAPARPLEEELESPPPDLPALTEVKSAGAEPVPLQVSREWLANAIDDILPPALERSVFLRNQRSLVEFGWAEGNLDELDAWMPQFQIVADTGAGKTTTVVDAVLTTGKSMVLAVKDRGAAHRAVREINARHPGAAAYYPALSAPDEEGVAYCDRHQDVVPLVKDGVSQSAICHACPLRDDCRALEMRRTAALARVCVITHDSALIGATGFAGCDVFVADEVVEAIGEPVSITLKRLRDTPAPPGKQPLDELVEVGAMLHARFRPFAGDDGRQLPLDALVFSPAEYGLMRAAIAAGRKAVVPGYGAAIKAIEAGPTRPGRGGFDGYKPLLSFVRWLQALVEHHPQLGKLSGRVSISAEGIITIIPVRRIADQWQRGAVVISMTATPPPVDLAMQLGRYVQRIEAPRIMRADSIGVYRVLGAVVTSTKVVKKTHFARIVSAVQRVARGETVVFVQKKRLDAFREALPGLRVEPWAEAIGSNDYKEFDTIILLGLSRPTREGAAEWQSARRGEWCKTSQRTVWLEWREQAEVLQAIGRIRQADDKGKPQAVWVFDQAWPDKLVPTATFHFDEIVKVVAEDADRTKLDTIFAGAVKGLTTNWRHAQVLYTGQFSSQGDLHRFAGRALGGRSESKALIDSLRGHDSVRPPYYADSMQVIDYRERGGTEWSQAITPLADDEIAAQLTAALGVEIEIRPDLDTLAFCNVILPASWAMLMELGFATTERKAKTLAAQLAIDNLPDDFALWEVKATTLDRARPRGSGMRFWVRSKHAVGQVKEMLQYLFDATRPAGRAGREVLEANYPRT